MMCYSYKFAKSFTRCLNKSLTSFGDTISSPAPICKIRPTNSLFTSTSRENSP